MTTNKKEPLCWVPYYSMEIKTNGTITPCCRIAGTGPYTPESTIDDFYSEATNKWRQENFEDSDELPESCVSCKFSNDIYSYKNHQKNNWQTIFRWPAPSTASLRKILIALDNVCASSCVMCGPLYSSTIANFLNNNTIEFFEKNPNHKNSNLTKSDVHQSNSLELLEKHTDTIEMVNIYGGEPLISPNLEKFINVVVTAPKLKLVSFSTGLHTIKEANVLLLGKHRNKLNVQASISLDGPLDVNYWARGVPPDELIKNFNLVKDNMYVVGFQSTIGIYNVFALPELVELIKKFWEGRKMDPTVWPTPVQSPKELAPNQLPDNIKLKVVNKLTRYLESGNCPRYAVELIKTGINMCKMPSTEPWDACYEYVHILPRLRGSTITLSDLFEQYL
jgi:hypothetical protein